MSGVLSNAGARGELVAPKVRSLSAAAIAARLDRRLQFVLTAGWIREQRHRTLRAALDWSHQLLDERQRQLFERLSVFAGSFTLDGAERVAGGGVVPAGAVSSDMADRHDVQAVVELAIPGPRQPVTYDVARGDLDRRGAGVGGERRWGVRFQN